MHRGHHIRAFALAALLPSCGTSLPRPEAAQVAASDYVPVPFAPRVPPVEFIPPQPSKQAVWVDGSWEWTGNRYGWRFGSWVIPPENARRARWVVIRRREDGQLFFAAASWKDASGMTIDDRSFATALGPQARARSRALGGAEPSAGEPSAGSSEPAGARENSDGRRPPAESPPAFEPQSDPGDAEE